jgi:hypothetical protein
MPIFMDRHELAGVSAEQVAEAHLKDLAIQDRYGVKFLTYWFDEALGTNFYPVQAPHKRQANSRVHHEAHGAVAMIEVDLATVETLPGEDAKACTTRRMPWDESALLACDPQLRGLVRGGGEILV